MPQLYVVRTNRVRDHEPFASDSSASSFLGLKTPIRVRIRRPPSRRP
jgi:hypothetical protein